MNCNTDNASSATTGLNPRFDGAFLNSSAAAAAGFTTVLYQFKKIIYKRAACRSDSRIRHLFAEQGTHIALAVGQTSDSRIRPTWMMLPNCFYFVRLFFRIGINPRFDGAFLNSQWLGATIYGCCLNPRFDGAFLNLDADSAATTATRLNPRFDGAFLNLTAWHKARKATVLIPDLMGLF